MHEIDIIKIIERRQAKFQTLRRPGTQEQMDEVARLIAEEYDSLLAEIEAARFVKSRDESATSLPSREESDNEAAEAEILGDQGQSGG
jgi:hypothetical protein